MPALLNTLLVLPLHLPSLAFVFRLPLRPSQRFDIVDQIPHLRVLQNKLVRRHWRPVKPSQNGPEQILWSEATFERSLRQIRRLYGQVFGGRSISLAALPMTLKTLGLLVHFPPMGDSFRCPWRRWGNRNGLATSRFGKALREAFDI